MVPRHRRVLAVLAGVGIAACSGGSGVQTLDGAQTRRDACRVYAAEATGIPLDQLAARFVESDRDGGAEYVVRSNGRGFRCAVSADLVVQRFGPMKLGG